MRYGRIFVSSIWFPLSALYLSKPARSATARFDAAIGQTLPRKTIHGVALANTLADGLFYW